MASTIPQHTLPTDGIPHPSPTSTSVETDLLIVGAGPAGASLACFLARYNLKGLMISSAPGTADTPRAHMNNEAALECLRDIGLWEECKKLGHAGDYIKHFRWCESMSGEEYARAYSWGHGARKGEYEAVSPCHAMDLPQSLLEPVLVKYATNHGFKVRFDVELLSFAENEKSGKVDCLLKDLVTGLEWIVRTRFLFGADGGRSRVAKSLGLPFTSIPSGGTAWNILVKADLSHIMPYREGNLHWVMRLKRDYEHMAVCRMVKPWTEWMFVMFPKGPGVSPERKSKEVWKAIVEDMIDDESVEVEVVRMDKWTINETSADVVSKGNVFCLGDAIHRHPPTLGLGSNTCIQDSYNLAWKINLVLTNLAPSSLLATYNIERQPVGAQLVTASNNALRRHFAIWEAIGCAPPGSSEDQRLAGITELRSNTIEGKERRNLLKTTLDDICHETQALGVGLNQLYTSSGIYVADEPSPHIPQGREADDAELYHELGTYPGRRFPHAWLGTKNPGPLVSTLDVAGKGRFTLFSGMGGEAWSSAADAVEKELSVEIKVVGIGRGLEWEDVYLDWESKKGIEEEGCVLVRPDCFVAWRAVESGDEEVRLRRVMRAVLHLDI